MRVYVCVCVCICVCVCVVYICLIKYGSQCDVALCIVVLFFNRRVGALGISSKVDIFSEYDNVGFRVFSKNQILLGGCFSHGSDPPNPNPYMYASLVEYQRVLHSLLHRSNC